jgi:hypothetical protein
MSLTGQRFHPNLVGFQEGVTIELGREVDAEFGIHQSQITSDPAVAHYCNAAADAS